MYKKITELRKAWKLQEAYEMSVIEYNKTPFDRYVIGAFSWVLYDCIIINLQKNNFSLMINYFNQLKSLDLERWWEFDIYEKIASKFYSSIKDEKKINIYKQKIFYYLLLDNERPGQIHSYILYNVLHRIKKNENNFAQKFSFYEFIKLWWIENFQDSDYQENEFQWKKLSSVFEKVISELWNIIKNTKNIAILWDVTDLRKILQKWLKKNLKWAPYYLSKLELLYWNYEIWLQYTKNVVKQEQAQFWAWHLLAEVLWKKNEKDLYFSWLSKALLCGVDDNFLNNLREEYIYELLQRWYFSQANIELNKIIKNKIKNNYKISDALNELKSNNWYQETNENNKQFYQKNTRLIEDYLYADIPEELIYIEYINTDKKIIHFLKSEKLNTRILPNSVIKWFFHYGKNNISEIRVGDVIKVKIWKEDNNKYKLYKLFSDKYHVTDIFESINILIENINFEKNIVNFIAYNKYSYLDYPNYFKWFFNFSSYQNFFKNKKNFDIAKCVLLQSESWEYYKLLWYENNENIQDEYLLRDFNGRILRDMKNDFAFCDDVYIGKNLAGNLSDGDNIEGTAKIWFNKKRNMFSWNCIKIR